MLEAGGSFVGAGKVAGERDGSETTDGAAEAGAVPA
jgi:hypothetical protein